MNAPAAKPVRRHLNVSKVVVELDGKRYRFTLTRAGLIVRQWHSQKSKVLSFSALLDLSIEQKQLW